MKRTAMVEIEVKRVPEEVCCILDEKKRVQDAMPGIRIASWRKHLATKRENERGSRICQMMSSAIRLGTKTSKGNIRTTTQENPNLSRGKGISPNMNARFWVALLSLPFFSFLIRLRCRTMLLRRGAPNET